MRYLLLINKDEAAYDRLDEAAREALNRRYRAYGKQMAESGILVTGALLEPAASATTVRKRDGKRLITDGPFAETEEQIAGFAIIDVPDLDRALEWAANHPDAEWASVEVRPIVQWERARD